MCEIWRLMPKCVANSIDQIEMETSYHSFCNSTCQSSAVMVTVERLLAIMKPLSIHLIFSKKRLWLSIVCIFVFSFFFQIFFWFIYYVQAFPDCQNLKTFHSFAVDVAGTKYDDLLQFLDGTSVVVGEIVPFFVMLTINTWLIYKLYKEHKFIQSLSSTKTRQVKEMEVEHKVTIMAVAIMVSFFVFVTPSTVTALMHMTIDKESSQLLNLRQVMQITHCLLYVNKALNFPLYCLSSRHFRAHLAKILPEWIGGCGVRKSAYNSMSGSLPSLHRYHLVSGHGSSSQQPNNNEH
uniref:G-protein coupled receptors family 1 profile domain-containing protein n=1 Tax=Romanomermis culicivorax TaxID=13658 RepID=A0A915HXD0_ROMCU